MSRAVPLAALPASVRETIAAREPRHTAKQTTAARLLTKARETARRDAFYAMLARDGLPRPVTEVRFHPTRKWRFDYAWPVALVALEVEGGAFAGGRHTRGAGFRNDLAKYNAATAAGWRILRVLPEQLATPRTGELLRAVLTETRR